jgi:hypothetical protein
MREVLNNPTQLATKLDAIIHNAHNDETREFWRAVKRFAVNNES